MKKYPYRDALTWMRDLLITLKLAQTVEMLTAMERTGISYWDAVCLAGTILQQQKAQATARGVMVM